MKATCKGAEKRLALMAGVVAAVTLALLLIPSAPAYANNHEDSEFYLDNGQYHSLYWGIRDKEDASYVYVYAYEATGTSGVQPVGFKNNRYQYAGADMRYFDRPGTVFIANQIYEWNFRYASLYVESITPTPTGVTWIRGVWSPDSIDANGNPYI